MPVVLEALLHQQMLALQVQPPLPLPLEQQERPLIQLTQT
jgi:hypothetical protein